MPFAPCVLSLALAGPQGELYPLADEVPLDAFAAAPGEVSGRGVAGDVTGDLLPDAVWLRAGKPFVLYGPAAHRSSFTADVAATDVAVLAAGAPGEARPIALVNAGGLWELAGYDGGFGAPVLLAGGAWAGATRLLTGDTDGDGCEDLLGLAASGSVLVLHDRCGAAATTELAQPAAVLDLLALDWDGVPGDELAVLRTDGFQVLSPAGTPLFSLLGAVTGGFLARLREDGLGRERCAVVYTAGSQFVVVLDATHAETPLDLGSTTGFFAAAAADADGDGGDDLCLLAHGTYQALLLLNQSPAAATFASGSAQVIPLASPDPPPASWSAGPVLADLDLDGDPELLVALERTGTVELLYFPDADVPAGRDLVAIPAGSYTFNKGTKTGELALHARFTGTLPTAFTHVAVTLWREPDSGGTIDSAALLADAFLLDANGKTTLVLPFPEQDVFTTNLYHLDVRAVRPEGPERTLVASGPPAVHTFTTPEYLTSQLEDEFGAGIALRTFLVGVVSGKQTVKMLLDGLELAERALAPKDVKTIRIPKSAGPPDPF